MTGRLRFLLSKTLQGHALWDIGCDHGLLAEAALWSGKFSEVHFVDPLEHQIEAARLRIASHKRLEGRPAFFHSVAGQDLEVTVTGSAVIAGMGGETMLAILSGLRERGLLRAHRLVLSAHKDEQILRQTLQGWPELTLIEQTSYEERGRHRPVDVWGLRPLA